MQWEVTLRRKLGRRVGKDESRESAVGELWIDLSPMRTGSRPRMARVVAAVEHEIWRDLLPSLLDPRLICRAGERTHPLDMRCPCPCIRQRRGARSYATTRITGDDMQTRAENTSVPSSIWRQIFARWHSATTFGAVMSG